MNTQRTATSPISATTPPPHGAIAIVCGTGEGSNELSAFDAALKDAGTHDTNLIILSSVIPKGSVIIEGRHAVPRGEVGDLLFLVQSKECTTMPGQHACAGVGWAQRPDGSGVFVEHHGRSRAEVERLLEESLRELTVRRGGTWGPFRTKLAEATCTKKPVAVLVQALYMLQDSRTGTLRTG